MLPFAPAEHLRGSGVVVNFVHPGAVATSLIRERGVIGLAWRLMALFSRTEEQGGDTPLYAALAPEELRSKTSVRVRQGFEGGGGFAENVACLE